MARALFDLVAGTNEPIVVQLYPLSDEGGSSGISLSGISALSAHAKATDGTGSVIVLAATVAEAATGKVRLEYATGDFSAGKTYQVQIKFTDGTGKQRRYPSEDVQLLIRVNPKVEA